MKAVMLSIQPKWCELIASGKKTVEVRKTKPKIDAPFKCYIYCTHNNRKNALHLYINSGYGRKEIGVVGNWRSGKDIVDVNSHLPAYRYNAYLAEGKVIGEFVCRNIDFHSISNLIVKEDAERTLIGTCLGKVDVLRYIGYPSGTDIYAKPYMFYGWHISDLVIYDKPKELREFYQKCKSYDKDEWENDDCLECENPCGNGGKLYLERPPQSWCYVEERSGE